MSSHSTALHAHKNKFIRPTSRAKALSEKLGQTDKQTDRQTRILRMNIEVAVFSSKFLRSCLK